MTSSFTSTFGASPVSPVEVAYAAYTFNADLVLFWPQFSAGQTDVAARFMNMTATANSLSVFMPDATLNSVGYDAIIFNAGADTFDVVTFGGNAIVTIAPGQTYYLMLNGNTTQDGSWQTVQFGVGTSAANASALAGAGLLAASGLLNLNLNGILVSNDYTVTAAQRAILQIWNGGAGTITLPTAASVGNGFFFPLANNGSGSVVVATTGGDQIDGASSSTFSQTQSGFILSTGTSWVTVGKGIQNTFSVTLLNLNVAGSSDITETSAQAQNIIQQYTGIITGNINIIMPNTVQIYFVYNNTNGAFNLTVKTAAGAGVVVAQGQHSILYCDGTNIVNAFTASLGGNIGIVPGSSISPSLFIQGSSSTGLYSPASNQIAVSANSFEVMNFISVASSVNYLQASASATGTATSISALGTDANISFNLVPKGSGSIGITKAAITGGAIDGTVIGGSTPAAITGTTITGSSFVGNLTGDVTGNVTGNLTGNVVGNLTGNVTGNVSGSSGSTTGNAATATALQNARTIGGVSFDGTASIVPQTIQSINEASDTTCFPLFISASGSQSLQPLNNTSFTFNAATGALGATSFSGAGTGLTGTAASLTAGTVTTNANLTGDVTSSGNATTIKINVALAGSPTTTTQSSNDSSTKIATTAFVNPANSISTNGYQKLSSGLIIQWGSVASPAANSINAVSFPLTFPSAVFGVIATVQGSTATGVASDTGAIKTNAITTSGMNLVYCDDVVGTSISWYATGH